MEIVGRLLGSGSRVWQQLAPGQKALAAFLGVGVVALFLFYANWARTPDFATAFKDLDEADGAAIASALKESGIPYRLSPSGKSIMVPSQQVQDVRLQMASQGLPKGGGIGFEIFDRTNFGLTEQAQKVNYQRALEGELGRTIGRLEAIQQARVHLAIPQQTLYSDKEKEAKVSVFLTLRPGRQLTQSQVKGIVSLVAKSVDGLEPGNITVVDNTGKILSESFAGEDGDSLEANNSRIEAQQRYEEKTERNVRTMLETVLGADSVAVRVNAQLNWDKIDSQKESYAPQEQGGVLRSSREQTEVSAQKPPDGSIAPGTKPESGVPVYQEVISGNTPGYYESKDISRTYEVSKTVERITTSPGGVRNLSVAVVVDSGALGDEAKLQAIKDLVMAASGADASRGDTVTVTSLPFKQPTETGDAPISPIAQPAGIEKYLNYAKMAAIALGPLLLLIVLRNMLNRSVKRYVPEPPPVRRQTPAITQGQPKPQLIQPDPQRQMVRQQVENLARQQPAMLGNLINTWLEEDKKG